MIRCWGISVYYFMVPISRPFNLSTSTTRVALAPSNPKGIFMLIVTKAKRLHLNLVGNSTLHQGQIFLQRKDEIFTESKWAPRKKLQLGYLHICFVLCNLLTVKLLGKVVPARDPCQVCIMLVRSELLMSNWNFIIGNRCHTESWSTSRTNFMAQ